MQSIGKNQSGVFVNKADGDMIGVSFRTRDGEAGVRLNDAFASQMNNGSNAQLRTTSGHSSVLPAFNDGLPKEQVEIFVVFTDGEARSTLASELRRASTSFEVRPFDTVESFLLHLMRHPITPGTQRFAVSQLSFSGMSGVEGLTQICKLEPNIKTILVGDDPGAATVIQAWRQGAADFLLQPLSPQEISQSIVRLIEREQPPNRAVPRVGSHPEASKLMASLTRRELEVFKLVVRGHLNKEMAQILHISLPTVKMHRANLMRKLGLVNAAQLVAFYHESVVQTNRG